MTTPNREPLTPERVRSALVLSNGNITQAAATLGYSRQTVHEWMRRHEITVQRVVGKAA